MSDELKPCPFCGYTKITPAALSNGEWYFCEKCEGASGMGGVDGWNARPIEDALRAELAAMRESQRWIPVGERLPEENQQCEFYGKLTRHNAGYYENGFVPYYYEFALHNITHWRPLPAAPEVLGE